MVSIDSLTVFECYLSVFTRGTEAVRHYPFLVVYFGVGGGNVWMYTEFCVWREGRGKRTSKETYVVLV